MHPLFLADSLFLRRRICCCFQRRLRYFPGSIVRHAYSGDERLRYPEQTALQRESDVASLYRLFVFYRLMKKREFRGMPCETSVTSWNSDKIPAKKRPDETREEQNNLPESALVSRTIRRKANKVFVHKCSSKCSHFETTSTVAFGKEWTP